MTPPELTLELRSKTPSRIAMTMDWRDLLFLHFPCEPEEIQKLLPAGLTVDTYPDALGRPMAWVGLVPFRMEQVRPRKLPRFRRCEDFPETNVRTYCHVDGKDPGVWFFSLDAANPFACKFARRFFHLNYQEAKMSVKASGDRIFYESKRDRGVLGENRAECRVGENLGWAKPGTLEFFLIERYLLYSVRNGRLFKEQVYHPPYRLRKVLDFSASGSLVEVNGIAQMPFVHAVFSNGLEVVAGRIVPV